jgi:hypothetical protein
MCTQRPWAWAAGRAWGDETATEVVRLGVTPVATI